MKAEIIACLFVACLCLWVGFTSHQLIWYFLAVTWFGIAFARHNQNRKK